MKEIHVRIHSGVCSSIPFPCELYKNALEEAFRPTADFPYEVKFTFASNSTDALWWLMNTGGFLTMEIKGQTTTKEDTDALIDKLVVVYRRVVEKTEGFQRLLNKNIAWAQVFDRSLRIPTPENRFFTAMKFFD